MTRLAGEFDCDLPLKAAGLACVAAMKSLEWRLESIEPEHIVSYVNGSKDSPMIEVMLRADGEATVLRIVGSDARPDDDPPDDPGLIAALDSARFAIEAQIEAKETGDGHELRTVPADEEPSTRSQPATQRRILQSRVAANGGSLTMHVSELVAEFGFPSLSPSAMEAIGALLRTVGLECSPPLDRLSPEGKVTLVTTGSASRESATGDRAPSRSRESDQPATAAEADPATASAPTAPTNRLARASVLLSILWIGGIGSMLAILLGGIAQMQIDASRGRQSGRDLATAGIVIGAIGAVLTLIVAVVLLSP